MNTRMCTLLVLLTLLATLTACAPSQQAISEAIQATMSVWTPIPTYTAQPTYTSLPTVVVEVTRVKLITPTNTQTPQFTPTITTTPTRTGTPTRTPNASQTAQAVALERLRRSRGDGFYLINVDIAPGVWRSSGLGDQCYWSVTTATGKIIDNHYGMAGGTAYIPPAAFQVEFNGCGLWEFISPP